MAHLGWLVAAAVLMGLAASAAAAAAPEGGAGARPGILATLRRGHPRLFLTEDVLARIRAGVRDDPAMKALYERLLGEADKTMKAEPVRHELQGPRLLYVSRRCLDRVATLALAYRVGGDRKYAERAAREMEAAAAFRDWNPSHFLDTAEMTAALGIGYDWLHETLSEEQRTRLRQAILEKGLGPGLLCYRGEARYGWWTRARHNWSQVCNGGLAIGALAIADEEPEAAAEVLGSGLKAVQTAMSNFGVDGGWAEGPGYWGYTLMYTSRYLDALRTALGSMQGLEQARGLAESGMFRIYLIGPTGETFNFADARPGAGSSSAMFWLARTFDRPVYAWHERQRLGRDAFDLVWFSGEGRSPAETGLPLVKHFRGVDVVMFRSGWDAPDALWAGFKGGDNKANHSNLDLGSFVLETLGQRWAVDLGPDDYNLPGYFGAQRWTYYRLRTEGHNTLVLNGENQDPKAAAPIVAFDAKGPAARAVADLSAAYPMARSVLRGMAMLDARRVLVQDEVESAEPVEVVWAMHTRAEVRAEKDRAVLQQGGRTLHARILEPAGAAFEVAGANPPPPQGQQPDVRKLLVRLPAKVKSLRLAVELAAGDEPAAKAPAVEPLRQWPGWLR